jgi:hypothetical protein
VQMRTRLGTLGYGSSHTTSGSAFGTVTVDPEKAVSYLRAQDAAQREAAERYRHCILIEVWYEDLHGDGGALGSGVSERLCDALSLPAMELHCHVRKSGSEALADAVENIGALTHRISGTEFAWMLGNTQRYR